MSVLKLKALKRFGRVDIYPSCDRSALYAALMKSKAISEENLKILVALGESLDILDPKTGISYASFSDVKMNAS